MRKKAEAGKVAPKKSGKAGIANAAKKAIEEREAKNKAKKVYVDLWNYDAVIYHQIKQTISINPNRNNFQTNISICLLNRQFKDE